MRDGHRGAKRNALANAEPDAHILANRNPNRFGASIPHGIHDDAESIPTGTSAPTHTPTPTPTVNPTATPPGQAKVGDANCDSLITISDVTALLKIVAGLLAPCVHTLAAATVSDPDDVDCNGGIDGGDALNVLLVVGWRAPELSRPGNCPNVGSQIPA